ncbi:hypothetical protein [Pseudomonas rhodesiae]|uniref:Uncharacterized protein n=1 Tax=Pseudomonas rhodesiae TaxID=76760 RepID=A0AAE8HIF2_9PSED|nr:hypothetical protein [Pseudomonas rhodesiae]TWR50983.1 hypothetical protein FIV35_23345 [Pseudomonas rhodesiae]SDV16542.1 hypothetical protein SAMN04490209_5555 [Pseudomonas rhodesiae]
MTTQKAAPIPYSVQTTKEKLILAVRENDIIEIDGRTAHAKNVKYTFNSNGEFIKSFTVDPHQP